MRNEPSLDSVQEGIVRFDIDILLHRYMFKEDKKGTREIQCMMFIEVKTFDAELTAAQQETLGILSQVIRNRRRNRHRDKRGLHATDHVAPARVLSRSKYHRRSVALRMFGGHLLQLSGTTPDDSDRIRWDYKKITVETLKGLLRFDLDPDKPSKRMDWRRRSYCNVPLVQTELFNDRELRGR